MSMPLEKKAKRFMEALENDEHARVQWVSKGSEGHYRCDLLRLAQDGSTLSDEMLVDAETMEWLMEHRCVVVEGNARDMILRRISVGPVRLDEVLDD